MTSITSQTSIANIIKQLLVKFGENPNREGLIETPKRVEKMYGELLRGYNLDPKEVFKYFDAASYDGVIIIKNQQPTRQSRGV